MQKKPVEKPRGFSRLLYRFPIWLYRIGLGGLFGKRFILLTHIGRKSGQQRQVLLEVIRLDLVTGVVYVIAAYGEKADWVRNVRKTPSIHAQLGRQMYAAEAVFLDEEGRIREYLDYARRHPKMAVSFPGMVGYGLDGSEEDFIAFAKEIVIVAVKPA
ncbi:MAG: nitroreductase family deazaflavin-dependent oxidoreductase [Anaerolineales bacterium]|nr:nitroreductase family deazaflavin-dependent oxidoreductase [Anaerolineales bacterium]